MTSNKNQHFVPRCYLRQFASEPSRKTINLYNIDRHAVICEAPIKSQCSRDYFYGSDPSLEAGIQSIERGYASILSELLKYNTPISDHARIILPRFWLLQHTRTEAASQRSVAMSEEADDLIKHQTESFRVEIKQAVLMELDACAGNLNALDDLKIVLVRNRTKMPFVTSDDPAIIVNRWLQKIRPVVGLGCGIHAAGLICMLPVSPDVCSIFYDGDVYSIQNCNNWIDLRSIHDVQAINSLQYLNCAANLYFHDRSFSEQFNGLRAVNDAKRPLVHHRLHYAIESKSKNGVSEYVVVDKSRIPDHKKAFTWRQSVFRQMLGLAS